jgi:hypothetical protein
MALHTLSTLPPFFSFLIRSQSVGLLGRGISPSQGRYLHTEKQERQNKHKHTDINASSGIQNHDLSVERAKNTHALNRAATVIRDPTTRRYLFWATGSVVK